jgi:molybdopterin/thiamine biosynthesis adenylyltransferase
MNQFLASELKRVAKQTISPNEEEYLSLSTEAACQIAGQFNQSLKDVEIEALKNQVIPERYQRNLGTIGVQGQIKLLQSRVAIVGVGGLGGTALELLVRFGVGRIVIIDGDSFAESNLNRQPLSESKNIGKRKVEVARERVGEVNPATEVEIYGVVANERNLPGMIQGSQVVVDGLDNIPDRLSLEKASKKMEIPLVHGAIAGFVGQVTTIFPGDPGLRLIYGSGHFPRSGLEKQFGTPCITPALIATWQVSEVIKILLGWENTLRNRVLVVDFKEQIMEVLHID